MSAAERKADEIEQTKRRVLSRYGGVCVLCDNPATQCAHVLPQDKVHLARFGAEIIHHHRNMEPVCGLRHNAAVQINARAQPIEAERFAAAIREIIMEEKAYEH